METLGAMLRRARLAHGRDLAELADQIKVHPRYLEALEGDDLKSLPGGFFYKSFVRQYATALGMDLGRVEHALSQVPVAEAPLPTPPRDEKPILKAIKPIPSESVMYPGLLIFNRLLPSVGVLLLVMISCGGFYVWWHRIETMPVTTGAPQRVSRVLPPEPEPTPPPAQAATPTPAPTTSPVTVEETPTATVSAVAQAGAGVKLTLTATEESWVRVWADGKPVFTGVLKPKETKSFEAAETARLRTGNSGALAIVWNGKQLEFPGPRVFVRDLSFTPAGWQPTPGAPPPAGQAATQRVRRAPTG